MNAHSERVSVSKLLVSVNAIRPVDLARHWGTGRGYVSNLRRNGMPDFESLEAADAWRTENAPPRGRRIASPSATSTAMGVAAGKTSFGNNNNASERRREPPEMIDTAAFLVRATDVDFDALMVRRAEDAALVADGLYRRACALGDPVRISGALKNLNEATRHAADMRERFMGLQQSAKLLAPVDKILDVIGTQLKEVQLLLTGMGARCGPDANPADPLLAQRIIDAEIDRIFAQLASAEAVIRDEAAA